MLTTSLTLILLSASVSCMEVEKRKATPLVCRRPRQGRGVGIIPGCAEGQEKRGALCYDSKQPKWNLLHPHIAKTCPQDRENKDGLCYKKCPDGYSPLVTECIKNCSGKYPFSCGLMCAKSSAACGGSVSLITGGAIAGAVLTPQLMGTGLVLGTTAAVESAYIAGATTAAQSAMIVGGVAAGAGVAGGASTLTMLGGLPLHSCDSPKTS